MPAKRRTPRLGKQAPRHRFVLNPYSNVRFNTCPRCSGKTKLRKIPLVVHVDPMHLVILHKHCRYCPYCDLIIAHKNELEAMLAALFSKRDPAVIGNDYLVVGTVDRADWREGMKHERSIAEGLERLHDFKEVLQVQVSGGWGPAQGVQKK